MADERKFLRDELREWGVPKTFYPKKRLKKIALIEDDEKRCNHVPWAAAAHSLGLGHEVVDDEFLAEAEQWDDEEPYDLSERAKEFLKVKHQIGTEESKQNEEGDGDKNEPASRQQTLATDEPGSPEEIAFLQRHNDFLVEMQDQPFPLIFSSERIREICKIEDDDERRKYFAYGDAIGCHRLGEEAIDDDFLTAAKGWNEPDLDLLAQRAAEYLAYRKIYRLQAERKQRRAERHGDPVVKKEPSPEIKIKQESSPMEQPSQIKEIPSVKGKGKAEVITIDSFSEDRDEDNKQPAVSEEEVDLLEVPKDLNKQDQEILKQTGRSATPLPEATCQCGFCQWPKGGEYGDEAIEGDVPPEDLEPYSEDPPLDRDVDDFQKEMKELGVPVDFFLPKVADHCARWMRGSRCVRSKMLIAKEASRLNLSFSDIDPEVELRVQLSMKETGLNEPLASAIARRYLDKVAQKKNSQPQTVRKSLSQKPRSETPDELVDPDEEFLIRGRPNKSGATTQGGKKDGTDVNAPTAQPKLLVLDREKWKSILDGLKKAMDQALNQHGQKTLGQGFTKFSPIPISLEWAYHLSNGCGEFVSQFPQGYMTISTPGHRLWCLIFAVHRSLILLFGDQAPTLVQLFRSYVMVAGESHILQDNIARQRFRIEQAGAFVNRTTRRLLNKTVQVGQLRRPIEPVQTVFATLYPFGGDDENQMPDHTIWINYLELGAGHYEPIVDLDLNLSQEMEELFTQRTNDETPAHVEAILFLDHELRRRDQTLAALNNEEAQIWVEVLLLHDQAERNDLVEEFFGPRLAFSALDAHEQFGQIELGDSMYCTPPPGPKKKTPGEHQDSVGDNSSDPTSSSSSEKEVFSGDEDPIESDDDQPLGQIWPKCKKTSRGETIWRGSYEGKPIYIPRFSNADRYALVETIHGRRAVPRVVLDMTEGMRVYTPTSVRLYLQLLSWSRLPTSVPPSVRKELEAGLATFCWLMKTSCQPVARQWKKTKHPFLSIILSAATNQQGETFQAVEDHLEREEMSELTDPAVELTEDAEGRLIIASTGKVICENGDWGPEFPGFRFHRNSARSLPRDEKTFRRKHESWRQKSTKDPRLFYQPTRKTDKYGRPVFRSLGEFFADDKSAASQDAERIPLDTFTRTPGQKAFARFVGCLTPHEQGDDDDERPDPPSSVEDLSLPVGRQKAITQTRKVLQHILDVYTKRAGRTIDAKAMIKKTATEMKNLDDYHSTDDSTDEGVRADRGFIYYFIGNRNRQRYYKFLRPRLQDFIRQEHGQAALNQHKVLLERELSVAGPKFVELVIATDSQTSTPRKHGQGSKVVADREDLDEYLKEHPDPVEVLPRGKPTKPQMTATKRRAVAGGKGHPRKKGRSAKSKARKAAKVSKRVHKSKATTAKKWAKPVSLTKEQEEASQALAATV